MVEQTASRPESKKQPRDSVDRDYSKNAGTQPQPHRQSNLINNAQKALNKNYAVPTHRRSNTAAAFVPQMTLKQFQEQKNAAMASS